MKRSRPVGPASETGEERNGKHLLPNLHSDCVCGLKPAEPHPEHNDELQKYISGIVSAQRQKLIAINNMPDHVHLLIGHRPDGALSDLVGDIKSGSTNFINRKRWIRGRLNWQEGFGAFSYSRSQLDTVVRYINNQQRHHRTRSFRDEYVRLLDKFDVPYDERYIFKFIQ